MIRGVPYDAEVEYLESTGTQWIDTGIKPNNNTHTQLLLQLTNINAPTILDAKTSWSLNAYTVGFWDGGYVASAYGASGPLPPQGQVRWTLDKILIDFDKRNISIGNLFSTTFTSQTFECEKSLFIFKSHSAYAPAEMKLYYCKIYDNDVITRDIIPVRVGSIGYMYDRVSHKLFGNKGTGNFILGPDVARPVMGLHLYPH